LKVSSHIISNPEPSTHEGHSDAKHKN